jgi:hypothetical protein
MLAGSIDDGPDVFPEQVVILGQPLGRLLDSA